jgi:hypothetical protein
MRNRGAGLSERLKTLKEARERMVEDRDAHAKVLAAGNKFTEMQALVEALDRAIEGEKTLEARN